MPEPDASLILLVNPNSNRTTTDTMVAIAERELACLALPQVFRIVGITVPAGPSMIIDAPALAQSAIAVAALLDTAAFTTRPPAGVIVSAFGDPGIEAVNARYSGRTVGIGSASLLEAASNGRRFAVATTTPGLVRPIEAKVAELGISDAFTGVRLTRSPPLELARDPSATTQELSEAADLAMRNDGAEAVVIGGGPLAEAARALRPRFGAALIEPIPAAVRRLCALIRSP